MTFRCLSRALRSSCVGPSVRSVGYSAEAAAASPLDSAGANAGGRYLRAEIDLSAITHNARAIKEMVGASCAIMAVVKANGYGLGATQVARAALDGGATWLAVARADEGVLLRLAGIVAPILVMGYFAPDEADKIVAFRLTPVLHRPDAALALDKAARNRKEPPGSVSAHLKIDTGLGRFGCSPEELGSLATLVASLPSLRIEGLMTHFASADSADLSYTRAQLALFARLNDELTEAGIRVPLRHAANSAAAISLPEARLDMVRTGIALTGHYPSPSLARKIVLRPAVTLRAYLVRCFKVKKGESVGYARTWIAERPTTIGVVPAGYADGYPRLLSERAVVLVGGRRCFVVGRVSMDQLAVDLGGLDDAREGDEVVLFGQQGEEFIGADEIAGWARTISYDILTGITPRVPRWYYRDGQLVEQCDLLGCRSVQASSDLGAAAQ